MEDTRPPVPQNPINELATALAKAQGEILDAELDCENPAFNRPGKPAARYASLGSVWRACRAALSKNGLAVLQGVEQGSERNQWFLRTELIHSSGQSRAFYCPMLLDKQSMHGIGSAITYAKRYSLAALVGVVDSDDDDGNEAALPRRLHRHPLRRARRLHRELRLHLRTKRHMRQLNSPKEATGSVRPNASPLSHLRLSRG